MGVQTRAWGSRLIWVPEHGPLNCILSVRRPNGFPSGSFPLVYLLIFPFPHKKILIF